MSDTTSHWAIDGELTFAAADGERLDAHGDDLALETEDGVLHAARLTFTVTPDVYARIDREARFHLDAGARGPGSSHFEPGSDVQIEARLHPALLPAISALGTDIVDVGPRFSKLEVGSPLLETESWFALHVTVEVMRDAEGGGLREGYSTVHAGSGDYMVLPMLAIAAGALEERGFEWEETSDEEVIRAEITGENGEWACFIVARRAESRCTVYSQVSWGTPESQRNEMAELITRINFGLPLGNFEMDFSDGEVRFKTSLNVSGDHLSVGLFDGLFEPNVATMDHYLPALEAVRDGRMTPPAAVEMVER